jgi:hypothetical protein
MLNRCVEFDITNGTYSIKRHKAVFRSVGSVFYTDKITSSSVTIYIYIYIYIYIEHRQTKLEIRK